MSAILKLITDLRHALPSVQDQGQRPTCVAFAVTACHEHLRELDCNLSEDFLYGCSKLIDKNQDDGTTVVSALEVLKRLGQALEKTIPYNEKSKSNRIRSLSLKVFREASKRKIFNHTPIVCNEITMKESLKNEEPIIAVIKVDATFFYPVNGYINLPSKEDIQCLHAILIVGYGEDSNHNSYYLIRNSWGQRWGEKGYAYLSLEYFNKYQKGVWVIPKR